MTEPYQRRDPGYFGRVLDSFLHEPAYPALTFTLEWRHDAQASEWVLFRRNARGAGPSVVAICALGGTVIGGLLRGWMRPDDGILYLFTLVILICISIAIYRLGSSTRLTLRSDAEIEWDSRLYGVCFSRSTIPVGEASMRRGIVRFWHIGTPEVEGVWIEGNWRGMLNSIVLARGKRDDIDAYIKRLPPILAASIQQSQHPHLARFGPLL